MIRTPKIRAAVREQMTIIHMRYVGPPFDIIQNIPKGALITVDGLRRPRIKTMIRMPANMAYGMKYKTSIVVLDIEDRWDIEKNISKTKTTSVSACKGGNAYISIAEHKQRPESGKGPVWCRTSKKWPIHVKPHERVNEYQPLDRRMPEENQAVHKVAEINNSPRI